MNELKEKIHLRIPNRYILFFLSLACILIIGISYFNSDTSTPLKSVIGSVIAPIQAGINKIGKRITSFSDDKISLRDAIADNTRLKEENEKLKSQISAYESNLEELKNLRVLLQMKENYTDYETTGASVIGKDPGNWYQKFTINKGSKDGILVNMTVINGEGLVGVVTSVSDNYSTVTSIIDDSSNLSCMTVDGKISAIASGNIETMGEGKITLSYIDKDAEIKSGEKLVTSNISDVYLPDIPVGFVSDISLDSNHLTQSGHLIPAVDFSHLEEVLVIKVVKQSTVSE